MSLKSLRAVRIHLMPDSPPAPPLRSLEVTLQKRTEGPMWPELVVGDRGGEQVISDEQAALIHQRLSHLTTDELVGAPSPFCKSLI